MATKVNLLNAAILELGHERIVDTGQDGVAPKELNFVYTQVVDECLAAGSWNFAMETVQLDADTGVTPEFGYPEVFAKPTDWVRTIAVSADERFSYPLLQYYDDASFWSADVTPIYVRYVSDDTGLGYELTRWPANFTRFVELSLAERVCMKVTQSKELRAEIQEDLKKARLRALNVDAMNEPQPKFAPMGSWNASRGGGVSRRDRGSRGSLTG